MPLSNKISGLIGCHQVPCQLSETFACFFVMWISCERLTSSLPTSLVWPICGLIFAQPPQTKVEPGEQFGGRQLFAVVRQATQSGYEPSLDVKILTVSPANHSTDVILPLHNCDFSVPLYMIQKSSRLSNFQKTESNDREQSTELSSADEKWFQCSFILWHILPCWW